MIAKRQQGFTLIELMIVVAIVGILLAIAIPAYSDYTVRARMSEAVAAMAPAKMAISEYRLSGTDFPASVTAAGFSSSIQAKVIDYVSWDSGNRTLSAVIRQAGGDTSDGQNILMKATVSTSGNAVLWDCQPGSVPSKYLPSECRDTGFYMP